MLVLAVTLFSGCSKSANETSERGEQIASQPEKKSVLADGAQKNCQEERVDLPNYGDPGRRLKNCFVEYPGEPSRGDKSYYIVEDVCGQFTQKFMENMLGRPLTKVEPPKVDFVNNCTYYFDDKEYVVLNLEYLKVENQKKGHEVLGRKVEKDPKIPMDNLVVSEESGALNVIYLVLNPEKFLSIRPSSEAAIEKDKLLELASNLAGAIKNYK